MTDLQMAPEGNPILEVRDLSVRYRSHRGPINTLRNVSLTIQESQVYALVGESGSGKTTLGYAAMGYLPPDAERLGGEVFLEGFDLFQLTLEEKRRIWRDQVAYVPQDPLSSLNPSMRIKHQIAEVIPDRSGMSKYEAEHLVINSLEGVRFSDPRQVANQYPFELSGGMQQRILLAMAFITQPKLLILDEPTSSLDVTTQAAILDLLTDLVQNSRTTSLYISHNLGIVHTLADRVGVLYAGELFEEGPVSEVFGLPYHPYTTGLIRSNPSLTHRQRLSHLPTIPGSIPALTDLPSGCIFRPRCAIANEMCQEHPAIKEVSLARIVRCHHWDQKIPQENLTFQSADPLSGPQEGEVPVLSLLGLEIRYSGSRGLVEALRGKPGPETIAVHNVSFMIPKDGSLGLVGESGSGKTSLAKGVLGLVPRSGGLIALKGQDLSPELENRSQETLSSLQAVFQNPSESFNPRSKMRVSLRRPLQVLGELSKKEAETRVYELLEMVNLPTSYADRYPGQLSGGELQRVAIARAFSSRPDLLVADEAVSALDVSVQASILNLLSDLHSQFGCATLLISHDISVVVNFTDIIAVLYRGTLMELVPSAQFDVPPIHPYTELLLSAIPGSGKVDGDWVKTIEGEYSATKEIGAGCPFQARCHRGLGEICENEIPPWQELDQRYGYRCHLPIEGLKGQQEDNRAASAGEDIQS